MAGEGWRSQAISTQDYTTLATTAEGAPRARGVSKALEERLIAIPLGSPAWSMQGPKGAA